jgi:ribonuclease HI
VTVFTTTKTTKGTSTFLVEKPKKQESEGTDVYKRIIVFSDGGARSNPGPAAIAFIIQSENGQTLITKARYIGSCTNNQAEYEALIAALESALALNAEEVTCHLDSELVAKQLTGEYTVKNLELKEMWNKVQELNKHFKKVSFINVPRTNNYIQKVDKLVNETLDEELRQHSGEKSLKL